MVKLPITEDIPLIEIRHKGLYDLDSIYKSIRAWLREREYDYMEGVYKDKIADFGNEVELKMNGELKVTDFIRFNIDLEGKFYNHKDFETDYMGEKRMVSNGQFFIQLKGTVTYDYQGKFKSEVAGYFVHLLVRRLFKNYYDIKYNDRLYYDIYNLQTLIKDKAYMESASNAY